MDERLPVGRRAPEESWKSYNPVNPDSDKPPKKRRGESPFSEETRPALIARLARAAVSGGWLL